MQVCETPTSEVLATHHMERPFELRSKTKREVAVKKTGDEWLLIFVIF